MEMEVGRDTKTDIEEWWTVNTLGLIEGPFDTAYVRRLFELQKVQESDDHTLDSILVWKKGDSNWIKLSEVKFDGIQIVDNTAGCTDVIQNEINRLAKREKKRKQILKRKLQNAENSIYITKIPSEVSDSELLQICTRCGILKLDENGNPKLKRYRNDDGSVKSDARATYAFNASVENALLLLDGYEIRESVKIHVEKAKFDIKPQVLETLVNDKRRRLDGTSSGAAVVESNAALGVVKSDMSASGRAALVRKQQTEQLVSWNEDEERSALRVIVLKNVFDPTNEKECGEMADAEKRRAFYNELREDLMEECEKFGKIEKLIVFEDSEVGAVSIKFEKSSSAVKCLETMKGRWLDGRQLSAEFFDGKTDYRTHFNREKRKAIESEREDERDKMWEQWLLDDQKQNDQDAVAERNAM